MKTVNQNSIDPTGTPEWEDERSRTPFNHFLTDLRAYTEGYTSLPEPAIRQLLQIVRTSDDEIETKYAREALTRSVFRLIPWAIAQSAPPNIPEEELVGEGFEVTQACIKNFDLETVTKTGKPVKFSSYVAQCLLTRFRYPRTFEDPTRPIRWPSDMFRWLNLRKEVLASLPTEADATPDEAQLLKK